MISFLNAILGEKDREKLVTLEIIENKELTRELIDDKTGVLDVRARTAGGMQLDIEVQLADQHGMEKRTLWYWKELFSEGLKRGDEYNKLAKVITINILDFNYISIPDKYHTTYHLWEDEYKDYMLTDVMEIHFLEMPKFRKLKDKNLKEDKLQRWLTFLREDISKEELEVLMNMDSEIKKAEEKVEYLSSDKETMELYKAREKSMHDRANMINGAKREGIAEGMAQGMTQGMAQGKFSVAQNLLQIGIDVETVIKATELPEEVIIELKNKLQH